MPSPHGRGRSPVDVGRRGIRQQLRRELMRPAASAAVPSRARRRAQVPRRSRSWSAPPDDRPIHQQLLNPMRRGDARSGSGAMPVGDGRSRAAIEPVRPCSAVAPFRAAVGCPLRIGAGPIGDTDRRRSLRSWAPGGYPAPHRLRCRSATPMLSRALVACGDPQSAGVPGRRSPAVPSAALKPMRPGP